MGIQVELFSIDGATHLAKIPKATDVAVMEELNGDGNLAFKVARNSTGVAAILAATDALVRVSLDGEPVGWGVLDQDADDAADKAHAGRAVTVTAPGTATLLQDAIVRWATSPSQTQRAFDQVSPGELMDLLLLEAQARGALAGVTWTFSDTHDSAGTPWPQAYSRILDVGYSLRALADDLAAQGLVDFRMVGLRFDMYVPDSMLGEELDVTLETAWLTSAPRQRTRAGKVTHMIGLGDPVIEGGARVYHEAVSPLPGRRREALVQLGGLQDVSTVTAATQAQLDLVKDARQGYTTTYVLTGDRPRPWADYGIGSRIHRRDVTATTGDGLEPLRIRSMSVELGDSGATAVTLELNDVFLEADLIAKRRLDALTNGGLGVIGAPVDFGADLTKPHAPTSVTLTSQAYQAAGAYLANGTTSWLPVTTNEDGSPAFDVVGYEAQWNVDGDGYSDLIDRTATTSITRDGFPVGVSLRARVRAVDRAGNYSEWTESDEVVTADDATPPSQPSQPSGTSRLGIVTYGWDGKSYAGGPMEGDTAGVQVHVSSNPAFVPVPYDTATMVDFLPVGGGQGVWGPAPYNSNVTVRLVAIDTAGNASAPSVARVVNVKPIYDVSNFPADAAPYFAAYVGEFLTINADQINANSAAIGFLESGLIRGAIFETTLGGEFRTSSSPSTSGGVRIRGTDGFKAWAPGGGSPTVSIDPSTGLLVAINMQATGGTFTNVLITGTSTFQTASPGSARLEMTGTLLRWLTAGGSQTSSLRQDGSGPLWAADSLGYSVGFVPGVGFSVNNPLYVASSATVNGDMHMESGILYAFRVQTGAGTTTQQPNVYMDNSGRLFRSTWTP